MNRDEQMPEIWWPDLPKTYFEDRSDRGLILYHPDDAPDLQAFSGDWSQYNDDIIQTQIFHMSLTLRNINGNTKLIHIPKGKGRFECFSDFSQYPDISYYPSVFEANKRLVCYCHGTDCWDGLQESSIVTIDLDSGKFYNQYWFENKWLEIMRQAIPGIGDDVDMWSNGGLQLYLDVEEAKLLLHGDYGGKYPASLLFEWKGSRWELIDVMPGPYPSFRPKISHEFSTFRIGNNSLTRRFTGR